MRLIISNPLMSIDELNIVLQQYGCYVRATTTIDESIPGCAWAVIDSHGNKTGCKGTIEVFTATMRIERTRGTRK